MTRAEVLHGHCVVPGTAVGEVLWTDVPLSMMGGVDPLSGVVIDTHHPLHGTCITGRVLALPSGRGSCAGSAAIFEMLLNGTQPAALVFRTKESILAVGVVIAEELFGPTIPVVQLDGDDYAELRHQHAVHVDNGRIWPAGSPAGHMHPEEASPPPELALSETDESMLRGAFGAAARVAMRIIIRAAHLEGARELVDVDMAHIDGCFYQGPASVAFAAKLDELGARVRVPSTMNSLRVDRRRWRALGVEASLGTLSEELADHYVNMGVSQSYTCAPYLLDSRPIFGQQIAWAESNAVVFANSVLGARTLKYPDYLDILVAITGRAPLADTHLAIARRATVHIEVDVTGSIDDAFYPTLGYCVGAMATNDIPVLSGLEASAATPDDLKAFGAAFATTSAAPMFHIVGVTPEAPDLTTATGGQTDQLPVLTVTAEELRAAWEELNTATVPEVDVISLGNPHFSRTEIERLVELTEGKHIAPGVAMIITCGREVYEDGRRSGHITRLEQFGATFLNDTCWCLIGAPVIPTSVRSVMTNSGKYAHYGPAAINRGLHYGTLEECVAVACHGRRIRTTPTWAAQQ